MINRQPSCSSLREISERKRADSALRESEERLTLAFAGAQEGVWDWNLLTGDVVYSPRWKQMLGYGEDEIEPHVSAWERLLHPDDMSRAQELNDSISRGALAYEGEFRLLHKDGHYVQVLSRGYPVRSEPGGPIVRIVGTHFDLTERRQAESERARTELLSRLVFAQEDERRRIAREMHDQFGEQLTALSRGIGALKDATAGSPDVAPLVESLEKVARQLDRDVDQLVWELRPTALDDLGLRAALSNYVQDWSRRVNVPAELHMTGLLDDRLPPEAETTLYRVAQEALTNIAKHARATRVDVILERQPDSVRPHRRRQRRRLRYRRQRYARARLRLAWHAGTRGARWRHRRNRVDRGRRHDGLSPNDDAARRHAAKCTWLISTRRFASSSPTITSPSATACGCSSTASPT